MNLSYYLDLGKLCKTSPNQMESFFRYAFDIYLESCALKDNEIEESFIRDDDVNFTSYMHKSGKPLHEVVFNSYSGEVFNRIIPAIWSNFIAKDNTFINKISYGELSPGCGIIHPNAKLTIQKAPSTLWLISEKGHYYAFRNHHIKEKTLSADCEAFLLILLPEIIFTKKALASYKKLSRDDKKNLLSDLEKLNNFTVNDWRNGNFPIDVFSKYTGVNASDESDSTKKDPKLKEQRYFSLPGIGSKYCFLHIKMSNTYRIHFYPDINTRKIHIAYIGKHLKTAKNR